jgi:hypothetical protein
MAPTTTTEEYDFVEGDGTSAAIGVEPNDTDHSSGEFDPAEFEPQSDGQSVSSSVYRHHYENGRRYHKYRYGRYPIPNDEEEQCRDELKHAMHMEITK